MSWIPNYPSVQKRDKSIFTNFSRNQNFNFEVCFLNNDWIFGHYTRTFIYCWQNSMCILNWTVEELNLREKKRTYPIFTDHSVHLNLFSLFVHCNIIFILEAIKHYKCLKSFSKITFLNRTESNFIFFSKKIHFSLQNRHESNFLS